MHSIHMPHAHGVVLVQTLAICGDVQAIVRVEAAVWGQRAPRILPPYCSSMDA